MGPFVALAGDCAADDVIVSSFLSVSMAALCSKRRSVKKSSSHSDAFFRRRFLSDFNAENDDVIDDEHVPAAALRLFFSAASTDKHHQTNPLPVDFHVSSQLPLSDFVVDLVSQVLTGVCMVALLPITLQLLLVALLLTDVMVGGASGADSSSDLSLVDTDVLRLRGVRFPLH